MVSFCKKALSFHLGIRTNSWKTHHRLAAVRLLLYIIIVQIKSKFKEFAHKMKEKPVFSGIICEFNPLHRGHALLLQQAKWHSDAVVCVMSGNWVQRGEPAILSKFARAQMAIACGADLVAELPLPWACAGAERFAMGGVSLLDSFGCIRQLWFGSECGSAELLETTGQILLSDAFSRELPTYLKKGISFAAARQATVSSLAGETYASLLDSANNILGIEYCKAISQLHSSLIPHTISRIGHAHDSDAPIRTGDFPSASQLRAMLSENQDITAFLPKTAAEILLEQQTLGLCPSDFRRLETAVIARLRCMEKSDFARLPDVSEGLENRLYRACQTALSLEELYDAIKSKRYSHARIRRLVVSAFLQIPASLPEAPPYFRILAMNETGREVLHVASKTSRIPILSRPRDFWNAGKEIGQLFTLEQRATDLFALTLPSPPACGWDCRYKIFVR